MTDYQEKEKEKEMTYEFVYTPDTFEQEIIAKTTYKRQNSIITRLAKEADKLFGKENWEQVPNHDNSLSNIAGWYARRINGYDTLETRLV